MREKNLRYRYAGMKSPKRTLTTELMSDSMHLVLNVVSYLLMIFTGAEFPVSQLPLAGRIVAQFMPLTKSISAMNLLFEEELGSFLLLLGGEIVTGVTYRGLAVIKRHPQNIINKTDLFGTVLLGGEFFILFFCNPVGILKGFHHYIHVFFCHFSACK